MTTCLEKSRFFGLLRVYSVGVCQLLFVSFVSVFDLCFFFPFGFSEWVMGLNCINS